MHYCFIQKGILSIIKQLISKDGNKFSDTENMLNEEFLASLYKYNLHHKIIMILSTLIKEISAIDN